MADFNQLLKVFKREKPNRPVLFELYMNHKLYALSAKRDVFNDGKLEHLKMVVDAYYNLGYDYATTYACTAKFSKKEKHMDQTISINEGNEIYDRASFEAFEFPDMDSYDYSKLEDINSYLPENFKLMVMGPGGVLENAIELVGYENLCYMLYDDDKLAEDIFEQVGKSLVRYYEIAASFDSVGVLMSNDDWGFNTQIFLPKADMERYVFPWHKEIVNVVHKTGKPCLLHSCGQLESVMDDIIDVMKYDAKHSFEDNILPIEQAYEKWSDRIAILGGIDVDFICKSSPEAIYERAKKLLEQTEAKGAYALGTGNSVPEYMPNENFLQIIRATGFNPNI